MRGYADYGLLPTAGSQFLRCLIVPGSNADTTQTYVAPHRQQLYIFADVPT